MDPRRQFGFLLRDTSRLYVQRFEQRAKAFGLTLSQCKALVYLATHEGISQTELAELTDLDPMTLVRVLDRMEADGWVERRHDPSDRRARCLYLTRKGRPLVDQVWELVDLTRAEAFGTLTKPDADLLMRLLETIHSNISALVPIVPPDASASAVERGSQNPARSRKVKP